MRGAILALPSTSSWRDAWLSTRTLPSIIIIIIIIIIIVVGVVVAGCAVFNEVAWALPRCDRDCTTHGPL
jgi:hypothetical protein